MKFNKKYNKLDVVIAIACASSLVGCNDVMDTKPFTSYDEELVWSTRATADAFVVGTYGVLNNSIFIDGGAYSPYTKYGVYDDFGNTDGFCRESYDVWSDYGISKFGALRRCNIIIEKAAESSSLSEREKAELISEGHFLKGANYYTQALWLGRFIPADRVYSYPTDTTEFYKMDLTANHSESYKIVMDEFDKAVENLPERSDPGRVNVYSAHIIRSRAALQAYAYTKDASYLDKVLESCNAVINSGKYSLVNTADAYKNMFLADGAYSSPEIILANYRLAKGQNCGDINELCHTVPNCGNDDIIETGAVDRFQNPGGIRVFEIWANLFPSQDLVDMFLVNDEKTGKALPWYETSQYLENVDILDPSTCTKGCIGSYEESLLRYMPTENESATAIVNWGNGKKTSGITRYVRVKDSSERNINELMYQNRDARFYGTIVYDNTQWMGETVTTNFAGNLWCGARKYGESSQFTTSSGYYWRKGVYEVSPRVYVSNPTDYHWVICRLAEAYLNAAEAYLYKKDVPNAVKMLNETRTVHGKLAPSTASTIEDAWSDYKRERICEFIFEGSDIYFSHLRWGIANSEAASFDNGYADADVIEEMETPPSKIHISRDRRTMAVGYITYSNQANRRFTPEHRYMMPIPQGFIDKRAAFGIITKQNPGW